MLLYFLLFYCSSECNSFPYLLNNFFIYSCILYDNDIHLEKKRECLFQISSKVDFTLEIEISDFV